MENIALIIALCASILFAMAAGYLRFHYGRKKDRIIAAAFSLVFALLCLVGIIIGKIISKPDSRENYDKVNSIYSEMQRLKEQSAAAYESAESTEE